MNPLRSIRTQRLWTQRELAQKSHVALRTINSVERGLPCHMETKRRIMKALGIEFARWREVFEK